ncbi:MAG: hypothetical protein OXK79_03985, partial [Chloroflexota bacterium]|nr:hypothetical protein [Chloroflexota bacterium]
QNLRPIQDDRMLADRCLAALLDFSDRAGKRLLLTVENLNMMFEDMLDPDVGWRLRKALQTEPRIMLLGSATSRFEEIDRPDRALYDLFRLINLRPLDQQECSALWEAVSGELPDRGKVRSLQILTGGSPRLIAIVAPFSAGRPLHELMDNLLDLIDEHTEYFKGHLDALASQERRVYLALADLWKPANTREIAERTRLASSTCSAQLKRLIGRGVVSDEGGTPRRKQYYLVERLYNIYYLLRRRGSDLVVQALIRFMASFYSHTDLLRMNKRIETEARYADKSLRPLYEAALTQLRQLPEFRVLTPEHFAKIATYVASYHQMYFKYFETGRYRETLDACDNILQKAGSEAFPLSRVVASVLVVKGYALRRLNRAEEALQVYDDAISELDASETPETSAPMANAMLNTAGVLNQLNRSDEALELYDDMIDRFAAISEGEIVEDIEAALVNRGITLGLLERPEEAVDAFDSVMEKLVVPQQVAKALANKGVALSRLGREEQALDTYNHLMEMFGSSEETEIVEHVAVGMLHKGITLNQLDRVQEAIEAYDDVVRRFDGTGDRELKNTVGKAMVNRAVLNSRYGTMTDRAIYERDLRAILPTLPRLDHVPESVIRALAVFSVHLGPERTLQLIQGSPAEGLLLPLVTALRRELGRKPRVAKEVSEIADDIRKELVELRTAIRSSDTMAPARD